MISDDIRLTEVTDTQESVTRNLYQKLAQVSCIKNLTQFHASF